MSKRNEAVLADVNSHRAESLRRLPDAATYIEGEGADTPGPSDDIDALPAHPHLGVSPIHSSEITTRSFRTVFRGLDSEAVREWLQIIQASQEALEDEVERLSRGWDELLLSAAGLRASLSEPEGDLAARWHTLGRCLGETRPNPELARTTTGFARAALDEAARGRRSAQAALFDAATQLARLQHETAVLRHDNETLRSRLIDTVAGASGS